MQAQPSRAVMPLVAAIVFIDMAGVGLIMPVGPQLIRDVTGSSLTDAALIGGGLALAYSLMLFVFAPVIGGLSDRFGRRPVLLVTLVAMGLDYLVMAVAPSLFWLFAGRLVSGVMGATWAAANSCIADLFPPGERGAKFGLLGGAGAAGFVLGPAIGGLLGEFGPRWPFLAAGGVTLLAALLFWLKFPETLPSERRRAFTLARANPLGTLIQMARLPFVFGVLATLFLLSLASQATMTVWVFLLIERFAWSPLWIGISVAVYGALLAGVQGGLTGVAIARIGPLRTAALGILAGTVAFAMLAFAATGAMLYLGIVIGACGGLTFPALQGLMSSRVSEDAQGELQGAVASTIAIAAIAGPLIMPPIFAAFSDAQGPYLPGAPFVLSSALTALGGIVLWRTVRRHFGEEARA